MLQAFAVASVVAWALVPPDPLPPSVSPPMVVPPQRVERRIRAGHVDLASLKRLVKAFDFEDAERFPREMPEDWYRLLTQGSGRPGYPDFGSMRLSDAAAHGGKWSLEFNCTGGSMGATLPPGIVHILPGSRYRLSCWVRTAGLDRASARMVARLHGVDGRPTGAEFATPAVRSPGEWTQIRLELPDLPADGAEMSLELELLQPATMDPEAQRPVADDIQGTVWFDDLEVWQVPSIRFETSKPAQLFDTSEIPTVEVELRDLVSDSLVADLRAFDVDGNEVAAERVTMPASGGSVPVALPSLGQPGWYRVELVVEGDGVAIARRSLDLAVVPTPTGSDAHSASPRFGLALPPAAEVNVELLRELVSLLDPDLALVPLWDQGFDPRRTTERIEAIRPFVDLLLDRRIEPVLVVPSVPPMLGYGRHLDPWQALTFFGSDDPEARAILEPWLLAFGQHVERWQVGLLGSPAVAEAVDVGRANQLRALLDESVAGPVLLLPAEADRVLDRLPSGLAHHVELPWAVRPGTAKELASAWASPEGLLSLELAPRDLLSERARIDDLALRTLDAWRAGASTLVLELAWLPADPMTERPASLLPEALTWRQLGHSLAGRSFAGEIAVAPGVHCWIARGAADAALVLWSDIGPQSIDLAVGRTAVETHDLSGRRSLVEPGFVGHRFQVDGSPLFVEGIDVDLAALQASARFEPPILESRRAGQMLTLVLDNPYPTSLSGVASVSDQPTWEIAPRQQSVSAAPRGQLRIPLRITLPRSAISEETVLAVDLEYGAGETHRIRIRAKATIDWPNVEIARSWRLARSVETGRIDLVVSIAVTNRTERPLDLEAFALAKDFTQNRKPIRRLASGQTAVRTFQFADGARQLSGSAVFLGINDLEGDRRLATSLVIPALLPPLPTPGATAAASEP